MSRDGLPPTNEQHALTRRIAAARVGLGRTGSSIRTRAHLEFQLDHAMARDAVHTPLDHNAMTEGLRQRGLQPFALQSAASGTSKGTNRSVYLRHPDLGRRLHARSAAAVQELALQQTQRPEVVFVLADGLSALALERHALPVLDATLALAANEEMHLKSPVFVASDARVALGDEIGALLEADSVVVLIGERPGLSAPDSLGVYLTWSPRIGRTDAERNCISNIRHEGLSYDEAAERIVFYLQQARRMQQTGVALKWEGRALLAADGTVPTP